MSTAIRPARPTDAPSMARLINGIIRIGGTTAHRSPFEAARIISDFISPPAAISCFVATAGDDILGFQALEWADPNWPGEDRVPADWAIIATYVDRSKQGTGVGRVLFAQTCGAARCAGVASIDATIRKENTAGLGFYGSLGFQAYRETAETVSKQFIIKGALPASRRERIDWHQT